MELTFTDHPHTARAPRPELAGEVARAIARARDNLGRLQSRSGAWLGTSDMGPIALAIALVVEKYLGVLSTEHARQGARALIAQQSRDGSFPAHPYAARGHAGTTALAAAALRATGLDDHDPAIAAADDWVRANGGIEGVVEMFRRHGDPTAIFLVLAGAVGPEVLPRIPIDTAMLPGLERVIERRVHAGNVLVLFTLMALADKLGARERPRGMLREATRMLARSRIVSYIRAFQNPNGSFNGVTIWTALMIVGLEAAGMSPRDPPIVRALEWLEARKNLGPSGLVITPFAGTVWSTAFSMQALLDCGVPPNDPVVRRAIDNLLEHQHSAPQPRALQRKMNAERRGGWSFDPANPTMQDCDDTAVVIAVLGACSRTEAPREVYRAMDGGLAWLLDMQNPDGGWPAYTWGQVSKRPGPMFLQPPELSYDDPQKIISLLLRPPPELGDPSSEGITGRVLGALAACGYDRNHPVVGRAIDFLKHQQCENGAWFGRWHVAYVPETALILMGLAAIGEDMRAPYVERAVRWLLSRQNADGGFGDTPEAYRDPALAGVAPSMAPVTGLVLGALVDAGEGARTEAERAASYLIARQDASGGWPNERFLHAYIPQDLHFEMVHMAACLPLLGLGRYRRLLEARGPGAS